MKRIVTSSFAIMLLLIFVATFAIAEINPAQMGDQGGANAARLEAELLKNNTGGYISQNADSYIPYGEQGGQILTQNPNGNDGGQVYYDEMGQVVTPPPDVINGQQPIIINNQQPIIINNQQSQESDSAESTSSGGVNTLDWFNVGFDLINKNKSITIYDKNTGTTWKAKYINGKNHADIVPASSEDAKLIKSKKITGSYVRRPVVVTIAGTKYAGSMYAVGHGSKSYVSYFKGVMCIHFTGSKTHSSNKVDKNHQAAIQQALK